MYIYLLRTHTHRYSYPFFGCPYPVVVQPPVPLPLNVDQTFTQSYCSFEFATEPQQLNRHISGHPLVVEVWQSCEKSHDLNIGTSEVRERERERKQARERERECEREREIFLFIDELAKLVKVVNTPSMVHYCVIYSILRYRLN